MGRNQRAATRYAPDGPALTLRGYAFGRPSIKGVQHGCSPTANFLLDPYVRCVRTFSPHRESGMSTTTTTTTEAILRPGERLVAGRPYIYDQDRLNLHLAREAVAAAPANLRKLGDTALRALSYQAVRVDADDGMAHGAGQALLRRIGAEYARRGWDSAGAPVAASKTRAA